MAGEAIAAGELVCSRHHRTDIEFVAQAETRFVLGSAAPHPQPLVMGRYSVHTSPDALVRGEAEAMPHQASAWIAGQLGWHSAGVTRDARATSFPLNATP